MMNPLQRREKTQGQPAPSSSAEGSAAPKRESIKVEITGSSIHDAVLKAVENIKL